jgi:uncharacterized delta-60 repeat protein
MLFSVCLEGTHPEAQPMHDPCEQTSRRRRGAVAWAAILAALSPMPAAVGQSVDDAFAPSANSSVQALAVDADDRLLVGGGFSEIDGQPALRLARMFGNGGLDPTFAANVNGRVQAILPIGDQVVIGGEFTSVGGQSRGRVAVLDETGAPVAGTAPQADDIVYALAPGAVAGTYLIGGSFDNVNGNTRTRLARMVGGNLDPSFVPPALSGSVRAIAVQADGKVLVTGSLTRTGAPATEGPIIRLNADGSHDPSFVYVEGATSETGRALALLDNGKILVGGVFAAGNVMRLNPDGSRDTGFAPPALNNIVREIAVQPDGRLVAVGDFTGVSLRDGLVRLHENGALDAGFAPLVSPAGTVSAVVVQRNGGVVFGGAFSEVTGLPRARLARILYRGALDVRLDAQFTGGPVEVVAAQPDGRLLVGGGFTHVNGALRPYLARINVNGSVDASFTAAPNNDVRAIAVLPDRSVLIGGAFNTISGSARLRIAKLAANGTVDPAFQVNVGDGTLQTIALQGDGGILIGGSFTSIGGVARQGMARLLPGGGLDPTFVPAPLTAYSRVRALAVRADDVFQGPTTIYVGGESSGTNRLERLNLDGTVDMSFTRVVNGAVWSIGTGGTGVVYFGGDMSVNTCGRFLGTVVGSAPFCLGNPDGRVISFVRSVADDLLIGGTFTAISAAPSPGIAHVIRTAPIAQISPDFAFAVAGEAATVNSVVLQDDGKLVFGGSFTTVAGQARVGLARTSENRAAGPNLSPPTRGSGIVLEWDRIDRTVRFVPGGMTSQLERAPVLLQASVCCDDAAFVPVGGPRAMRESLATETWIKDDYTAPIGRFYLRWRYQVADGRGGVSLFETPIRRYAPRSPVLAFAPAPAAAPTTVVFIAGAGALATAEIAVTPVGGAGGAATLSGCQVQNAVGPGTFAVPRANPADFTWSVTAGVVGLSCTRGAQATTAVLRCTEVYSDDGQPAPRAWGLTCPALAAGDLVFASGFE